MKKHDCLQKVREALKEADPKLTYVRFELSTIRDIDDNKSEPRTGQAIEYGYNHTKKNGEVVTKSAKSFVSHEYCPFCGKKYK